MIKLYISSEINDLISDRMILEDDLKTVIKQAQETGRRLLNKSNGHFLAMTKMAEIEKLLEDK